MAFESHLLFLKCKALIYHNTLSGAGRALTRGSNCTFLPSIAEMNLRLLWVTLRNGCSVGDKHTK